MTKKNPTTVGHQTAKGEKLGRTLSELESALSAWDALADQKNINPQAVTSAPPPEMIQQTKQLLEQLREQLADLSE